MFGKVTIWSAATCDTAGELSYFIERRRSDKDQPGRVAPTVQFAPAYEPIVLANTAPTGQLRFLHKSGAGQFYATLILNAHSSERSRSDGLNVGRSFTACTEALRDQARPRGTGEILVTNQSSRRDETFHQPASRP